MMECSSTDRSSIRSSNAAIDRDETPEAAGVERGSRTAGARIPAP
jgi:hypothetical protein